MAPIVIVYTQPNCLFSTRVKEFLREKGVRFVEKDIVDDHQALDELMDMGYAVTPLILIDGQPVVGFDRAKIERLLTR